METIEVPDRKEFSYRGVKIAYIDIGKGVPLVAIPGWAASAVMFMPLYNAIKPHIRLIAFDMPGWAGYSSNLNKVGTKEFAEFIQATLIHLGLDKVVLLGFSYGGMVAQIIASQNPQIIKRLVLVSSPISLETIYKEVERLLSLSLWGIQKGFESLIKLVFIISYWSGFFLRHLPFVFLLRFHYFWTAFKEARSLNISAVITAVINTSPHLIDFSVLKKVPLVLIRAQKEPDFVLTDLQKIAKETGLQPLVVEETDHGHVMFDILRNRNLLREIIA